MERYTWRVLVTLGLVVAATALDPQQDAPLSYEEAVSLGIDLYNQEPEVAFAFRLLEASPQPEWESQSLQKLQFTMKETKCPVSEEVWLEQCDFKDDGLVKECSGSLSVEEGAPVIQLNCETVAQESPSLDTRFLRGEDSIAHASCSTRGCSLGCEAGRKRESAH
ncbi:cathelicidin-related peptide Oh-Cath-like [Elgaria multicarinata webbii]|uniref:cathelicidin-related peptide Oh-Cath-like n=1 Tax=Elgaria multicarinata webbii TaxID=159646 RepID=UPI002FCCDD6C